MSSQCRQASHHFSLPVHFQSMPLYQVRRKQKMLPLRSTAAWASMLNTPLTFKSYLPLFEDIAGLPDKTSLSCDVQNDIEKII